jgi:hypothetical protein
LSLPGALVRSMNLLRNTKVALPLAATGALAAAAVAMAADREAALVAGTPYKWDGGPVTGSPLVTADDDDTLVTINEAGSLKVVIGEPGGGAEDIDLFLYKADAAGERVGDPVASSEEGGSDESISAKVAVGKYIISAQGWASVEGTYKGTATLTGSGTAAPAPEPTNSGGNPGSGTAPSNGNPTTTQGGGSDATPTAAIGKLAKSARVKKLKGFSGTASDDKGVAKVQVALVLKKGKKCTQMNAKGKFTKLKKCAAPTIFVDASGTTSWSYKLKKRLKKGSYTLFARAIDSAGQTQAGFTPANKKTFKVK